MPKAFQLIDSLVINRSPVYAHLCFYSFAAGKRQAALTINDKWEIIIIIPNEGIGS